MKSHITSNQLLKFKKFQIYMISKKCIHFIKPDNNRASPSIDNYGVHSPMYLARGKVDENRSRLFFESLSIPNRIPKYLLLFCILSGLFTGAKNKMKKRQKVYFHEKEKEIYQKIGPFIQAMEDLRFTAIEQREYMIDKAIADQYSPALFEHLRKRFNQEDIFVQTPKPCHRTYGKPIGSQNVSVLPDSKFFENTMGDRGLFDNRELGYSQ